MTEAKSMKMREYGTEVIAHDTQTQPTNQRTRVNNTFKSSVMEQTPESHSNHHQKSRDRLYN